jgi:8-oxo-dGTP diphosphatase
MKNLVKIDTYKTGYFKNEEFTYAVIISKHKDKWVFCMHEDRNTWEVPGGHREKDEDIDDAAKRELFEETGAIEYNISSICDYSVTIDNITRHGRLFYADIIRLEDLPGLEIVKIDFFDKMPNNLTYPDIQPVLFGIVLNSIL